MSKMNEFVALFYECMYVELWPIGKMREGELGKNIDRQLDRFIDRQIKTLKDQEYRKSKKVVEKKEYT